MSEIHGFCTRCTRCSMNNGDWLIASKAGDLNAQLVVWSSMSDDCDSEEWSCVICKSNFTLYCAEDVNLSTMPVQPLLN